MFGKKSLIVKNQKTLKLNISTFANGMNTEIDENLLPFKFAKSTFNFSVKKGALETSLGFENLTLPNGIGSHQENGISFPDHITEVLKIYFLPHFFGTYESVQRYRNCMLIYGDDYKLYFCTTESQEPTFYPAYDKTLNPIPHGIVYNLDGEDVMIFCSKNKKMHIFHPSKEMVEKDNAPDIVSMCKHYERIFAIEKGRQSKVVFSGNMDPTNWTISSSDAGFIELFDERGQLLKVVSFDDYVYLFREKGITRISAYGDQAEFNVTHMYLTSDKIYGESVCVCGDRIFFLTKNGLFSFDGCSTRKVKLNIESLLATFDNKSCRSAYYDGKLYIACALNFGDKLEIGCDTKDRNFYNNCLIEYDCKEGDLNILRGVDISDLCVVESGDKTKLVASFHGKYCNRLGQLTKNGKVFEDVLPSVWVSSYSNLGYPNKNKIVKEIHLNSKYDCKVKVRTENNEKTFSVVGSDVTSKIKTNMVGEMFEITFYSEIATSKISNAQIVMGLV